MRGHFPYKHINNDMIIFVVLWNTIVCMWDVDISYFDKSVLMDVGLSSVFSYHECQIYLSTCKDFPDV